MFASFSKLFASSITTKLLGLLLIPVITRIYGPDIYGKATVLFSWVLIIGTLLSLRFYEVIPLVKTRKEFAYIANISQLIITTNFLIVLTFLILFSLFYESEVFTFLNVILISFGALVYSFNEYVSMLYVREGNFNKISLAQLLQSFFGNTFKLCFGLFFTSYIPLFLGSCFQQSGNVLINYKFIIRIFYMKFKMSVRVNLLNKYKQYPLFKMPSNFLLVTSQNMLPLVLASFFSINEVGQLGLVLATVSIPTNLIGQNLRKLYYNRIAKRNQSSYILNITTKFVIVSFLITIVPSLLLFFFSVELYTLVFGNEWISAGVYAKYFSVLLIFSLVSVSIIDVFNVLERLKVYLYFNLLRFFLISSALYLSISMSVSFESAVRNYVYALSFCMLIQVITVYYYLLVEKKNV